MTPVQILVVEDQGIVAQELKRQLNSLGYTVPALAFSGEAAVQQAIAAHPDLVLMDIKLQGDVDGIQAAEQIRDLLDIPVVYMTAYADVETLHRARLTEPFGYIIKPVEIRELHSTVEMALFRHGMDKALIRRNRELALLNRVGQELTATLDFGQIAERLLPTVAETLHAEGASVWVWDEEQQDELICRALTHKENLALVDLRLQPDQGIAGWVMQTGRSVILADVREDSRFCPLIDDLLGFRTVSLLAVPLEARGKVIGVLEVVNKLTGEFSQEDLALVETLAASAGIAIDNANLFEMLQMRNRELALLNQTGQALSSILELDQVLVTGLEEISRLLSVTASSLWLIDEESRELVCRQASGPHSDKVRGWRLALGEGVAGRVAQRGRSQIVWNAELDPHHFKGVDRQTGLVTRSIATVPLRLKQDVIGVLQVVDEKTNRFRPSDLVLLESVAATAAIAIENARLYEQAQRDTQAKGRLLHEVNHRVKNNLTAIIGILYAERQRTEVKDYTTYQSAMQDLVNRVQGLATVHRLLSSADWAPLRLSDMTARVIHSSLQTLPRDKHVFLTVQPSEVYVTPDQAHQLALVINELATNTVKHTLQGRSTARIDVAIKRDDTQISCEFRDDGPGYPPDVLQLVRSSVGFEMVQMIVLEGLRGELALYNDGGAVTRMRFSSLVGNGE